MRINLKVWMFLQVIPAITLVLCYNLAVFELIAWLNSFMIIIPVIVVLIILRQFVEPIDELAKIMLGRVDAFCFKLSLLSMGIMILILFAVMNPQLLLGYTLVFSILAIVIIRATMFIDLDKRGM